jgi:hypothetical protein
VVHIVVMSFVWVQQLVVTVFDIKSQWIFTAALWPLGSVVFAAAVTLLAGAAAESGPGALISTNIFRSHAVQKGPVWQHSRQPFAVGAAGVYVGLGLLTGRTAYLLAAPIIAAGFWLAGFLARPLQP